MRKANKRIREMAVLVDTLARCAVAHLGTVGSDGWPMVKPLNFVYADGRVYFHCAREGEKLDDIRRDPRVCLEAALPVCYVRGGENPCGAEFLYRSVIIRGRAALVESSEERVAALHLLMRKYQPEGSYGSFLEEKLQLTAVVRIDVEEIVGKEDLGNGDLRERALELLDGTGGYEVLER